MTKAHIRFSASILKRLGEELNPSLDHGIVELVKNSYDADAKSCVVTLSRTGRIGGSILVNDDGVGMDAKDIVDGWLVLGRSPKAKSERTELGRIPTGNKGLGRLAALRMGRSVQMTTTPKSNLRERFTLRLDWDAFDRVETVDEVSVPLRHVESKMDGQQGTRIEIRSLKAKLARTEVKRLARSLILLANPFEDDPSGFQPVLRAREFRDVERLVRNRYFDDAEYHLTACVNNGEAQAKVTDFRGAELFTADHARLKGNGKPYDCPSAVFDLWVFLLNSESFSTRRSTLGEVRTWLESFGGVHVYENGLRVAPYGNSGNDWLDMNLMRAKSPEEKPSTNTSIGRISITDDKDVLRQKTDRSGFIEDDAFAALRDFARDALKWMAARRLRQAESRRVSRRAESVRMPMERKAAVESAIAALPERLREPVEYAFRDYDAARERETAVLKEEVQLYRTLSTAGITAATFAHESTSNPIKVLGMSARTLASRARAELGSRYDERLREPIDLILKATDALGVLGNVTLSLLDHEKRRNTRVDVHKVIRGVFHSFGPFLLERKIEPRLTLAAETPYLMGSEAAVEAIVTNVVNNSVVWLERKRGGVPMIGVQTTVSGRSLTVRMFDNGPGIDEIPMDEIWLPGRTTRPNGTGLGLTIVRDTVQDLGGSTSAVAHGEFGGAEIVVTLPILES
jgi:signal transduction histidine kinase